MPHVFQLTGKGSDRPELMHKVDEAMRQHFGAEPSEDEWYRNWYNTIGLSLAIGHRWKAIKGYFPTMADVVDWLEANYDVDSWREWTG